MRGSEGSFGDLYANADSPCLLCASSLHSSMWSITVPTISSLFIYQYERLRSSVSVSGLSEGREGIGLPVFNLPFCLLVSLILLLVL
jgi:hypothetical protein